MKFIVAIATLILVNGVPLADLNEKTNRTILSLVEATGPDFVRSCGFVDPKIITCRDWAGKYCGWSEELKEANADSIKCDLSTCCQTAGIRSCGFNDISLKNCRDWAGTTGLVGEEYDAKASRCMSYEVLNEANADSTVCDRALCCVDSSEPTSEPISTFTYIANKSCGKSKLKTSNGKSVKSKSFATAKESCHKNPNCRGIYDSRCNNYHESGDYSENGSYYLCDGTAFAASAGAMDATPPIKGSCVWEKDSWVAA